MKKVAFALFAILSAQLANAEYAVLKAADNYCAAEVRIGIYKTGDPLELRLVHGGAATKGQTWTGAEGERVCGRRNGNPSDCQSKATNWFCISPYKDLNPGKQVPGEF